MCLIYMKSQCLVMVKKEDSELIYIIISPRQSLFVYYLFNHTSYHSYQIEISTYEYM